MNRASGRTHGSVANQFTIKLSFILSDSGKEVK